MDFSLHEKKIVCKSITWFTSYNNSCDKEESLHRVMSLGGACEFREFPDMTHGWTTRGDIRSALCYNDYEHFRIFSILVTFYNHEDFAETQQ